ncbi:MAG TPA: cation:proton antiporter, partial [Bacillota bacterium]
MDGLTQILGSLFLIFFAAQLLGRLAERWRQPAVIGEILAGVLIGPSGLGWVHENEFLLLFAEIALVILLFEAGLGVNLGDFLAVGGAAAAVAVAGVALPFAAGWVIATLAGEPALTGLFWGAAMVATSVGVTARVLFDAGRSRSREARIILGAAVIDDILGLLVLALVRGLVVSGAISWPGLGVAAASAVAFIAVALGLARPLLARLGSRLVGERAQRDAFALVVTLALGLSALSAAVG